MVAPLFVELKDLVSEVEGLRTIGRIRNIPLDKRGFFNHFTKNVIPVSHVLKNSMEKLKSYHVIKLKIHEIKQVSNIYTIFLS